MSLFAKPLTLLRDILWTEKETRHILPQSNNTLWQFAHDNAVLVRDSLVRALQLIEQNEQNEQISIACVQDALAALERLRSRAPESSALLGAVLFFGIELEVRLNSAIAATDAEFGQAIGGEIERTGKLIAAIKRHLD